MIKKIFTYLKPVWSGKDKEPSIRRLLSLYFALLFTIEVLKKDSKADVLWVIAAMIAGLLSLTTFQNTIFRRGERDNSQIDKVED